MNGKDGLSAIALLALGVFALVKGIELPFGSVRAPDTAFFPVLLSALLIVLSLALLARAFWEGRAGPVGVPIGEHWRRLVLVIPALVAYFLLLEPVGYVICTAAMVALVAKVVKCSWKEAAGISVVCTVAAYWVIVRYLNGNLPRGILPF